MTTHEGMSNSVSLSTFLRNELEVKQMSVDVLAKRSGLPQRYVEKLLDGKRETPSVQALIAIGKSLGVPIEVVRSFVTLEPEADEDECYGLTELLLAHQFCFYQGYVPTQAEILMIGEIIELLVKLATPKQVCNSQSSDDPVVEVVRIAHRFVSSVRRVYS